MAKVNYYLKNVPKAEFLKELKKAKDKTYNEIMAQRRPIVMSVAYDGERHFFATGKFIPMKLWDSSSKRIKDVMETPKESIADREWLDAKKIEVEKLLLAAQNEFRVVTKEEISEIILRKIRSKNEKNTLIETLSDFLTNHETNKGMSIKKNTIKKYKTLTNHIISYQNDECFLPHLYSTMWVKGFKDYLLREKGLNDNSVCKYIQALKTFFTYLIDTGNRIKANLKEIKVSEYEQVVITVTWEEMMKLKNADLKDETQSMVRDIFLFQCFTGARHSDVKAIQRYEIQKDGQMTVWDYFAVKNNSQVAAPLHKEAMDILTKYKELNTPLPVLTNQTINRIIKEVAKVAMLDREVKKVTYKDGVRTFTLYKLYDVISTHTARKSFISIQLKAGVGERMVRAVSGHKDERSFRRYINLDKTPLLAVNDAWDKLVAKTEM